MLTEKEFIDHVVKGNLCTYNKEKHTLLFLKDNDDKKEFDATLYFNTFKKLSGRSFECIYDDHPCCMQVIKCTECSTVIFEHYDEDYEHDLKCPVCTNYKTKFKYYTVKDIENDKDKQHEINYYINRAKDEQKEYERYKKRGNLWDWEKTKKRKITLDNILIEFQFVGLFKWNLDLEIHIFNDLKLKYHLKIPISPKSIYDCFKYKLRTCTLIK